MVVLTEQQRVFRRSATLALLASAKGCPLLVNAVAFGVILMARRGLMEFGYDYIFKQNDYTIHTNQDFRGDIDTLVSDHLIKEWSVCGEFYPTHLASTAKGEARRDNLSDGRRKYLAGLASWLRSFDNNLSVMTAFDCEIKHLTEV